MELFKYKTPYDFMGKSRHFGLLSIVLVVASIVLLFTRGLNFGIDFRGGTVVQVQYSGNAPIEQVRSLTSESELFSGATVTYFGSDSEIVIKAKTTKSSVGEDIGDVASQMLAQTGEFELRRVDMVGPKVGEELRTDGIMAMTFAILAILIYVAYRFEYRFAFASIVALVHDITIVMGVLSLFQIEFNLDTLAALLTILGYSLNDTIIVFDRIREGLATMRSSKLFEVINESVTRTLSRTTLTSLTTFFVVLTLYLFGGEIISGFSFTLLVGIIVGTYSSIFVASPTLKALRFSVNDYRTKQALKEKKRKEKERLRAQYEGGTV
ncbi:MAG: protein translocase subunit SecF [Campylobacterota bacterium]